jgi:hypothetical protein
MMGMMLSLSMANTRAKNSGEDGVIKAARMPGVAWQAKSPDTKRWVESASCVKVTVSHFLARGEKKIKAGFSGWFLVT